MADLAYQIAIKETAQAVKAMAAELKEAPAPETVAKIADQIAFQMDLILNWYADPDPQLDVPPPIDGARP